MTQRGALKSKNYILAIKKSFFKIETLSSEIDAKKISLRKF